MGKVLLTFADSLIINGTIHISPKILEALCGISGRWVEKKGFTIVRTGIEITTPNEDSLEFLRH
jgi:hypothetical protein